MYLLLFTQFSSPKEYDDEYFMSVNQMYVLNEKGNINFHYHSET